MSEELERFQWIFSSIFNISNFLFFRVTLCICRSRLWAAELYLYGMDDSHDCNRLRSWDPQQSRQKPGAKIPIPIPKLFSKMNLYETEITKSLETQKSPKPKPHTLMSLFLLVSYPTRWSLLFIFGFLYGSSKQQRNMVQLYTIFLHESSTPSLGSPEAIFVLVLTRVLSRLEDRTTPSSVPSDLTAPKSLADSQYRLLFALHCWFSIDTFLQKCKYKFVEAEADGQR